MKPFLQGKKSAGLEPLKAPASLTGLTAHADKLRGSPAEAHPGSAAQVEVVKEGDKVVRLIVTCVCGERVEIDCLYSAGR